MFTTLLQVALGGAIGAAGRFLLGVGMLRTFGQTGFPVAVLAANVIGSFVMGLLVVYLGQRLMTQWNPFLMTGVLGGFTTFSAFSLEAYTLFERGEAGLAALYVGLSVVLSIGALVLGVIIMRGALA